MVTPRRLRELISVGKYRSKAKMYGFLQARASKNPKRNQDDRRPVVLRDEWRAAHPRKPKDRQPTEPPQRDAPQP